MTRHPEDGLIETVLADYDLGTLQAVQDHGGTAAANRRLQTTRGLWLLRTRGARTSTPEAVAFDHALRRHLVRHGVPTAAPVARRDGETCTRLGGRVFEVYPLLPGRSCARADDDQLRSAARALADFHRAAASFPLADDAPPVAQYATVGVPDALRRPEDPFLLGRAYDELLAGAAGALAEEAECCRLWLERLREEFGDGRYYRLPQVLTHGDYTLANLLFDGHGEVSGVFDFDWARPAARVRDLADGMYFIGAVRRTTLDPADIRSLTDASDFRVDRCVLWLSSYSGRAPLEAAEVHALPLAFAARWLSVRIEGTAKVPPPERVHFSLRDLPRPLLWLARHWAEVAATLGCRPHTG